MDQDAPDLRPSDILLVLADRHRRDLVRMLRDADDPVSVGELAARLGSAPRTAEDRMATLLHHVHLPTLAAHGIVEYDASRRRVRPIPVEEYPARVGQLVDGTP